MSALDERLARYRAAHPPRRVTTSAGDFTYTAAGPRERGALVVLHGGGSVAEAAHPYALALEPELFVLNVDWPPTVRSVDDVTAGLLAILDAERVARASFLGFSMGGMLAQAFAWAHPERTARVALFASMGPSARYAKRFRRSRRVLALFPDALLRAASKRAVAKWATAALDTDADREAAAFIAAHRRAMFDTAVTKQSLLSDADVLVDFFTRAPPALPLAPTPDAGADGRVLIVEGARDRMVDAAERAALRALYPRAQVVTLPASDHFAGVLAPAHVVDALRAFFLA